jgi:hypothetical protein
LDDLNCKHNYRIVNKKRYFFNDKPEGFLKNELFIDQVNNLIANIEKCNEQQVSTDLIYKETCDILINEMETFLPFKCLSKKSNKLFKQHKPYWDKDLSNHWKEMVFAEKEYLKHKNNKHKGISRQIFLTKRKSFDKLLRKKERNYNSNLINNLEKINVTNPKEFWKKINSFNKQSSRKIPKAVRINEEIVYNLDKVCNKWVHDYDLLLNKEESPNNFDDQFYNEICSLLKNMENFNTEPNIMLNQDISYHEVEYQIKLAKNNKSSGIDNIPNEVLKNNHVTLALYKLFSHCFNSKKVPSAWKKAVIVPIPKSNDADEYNPLSYRGISLLSCISKIYTGILNNRIVKYLETLNLLCEEQYGFVRGKSCEQQVYNFYSILQNRKKLKLDSFVCFIDFSKAFDKVNRNLLFYNLLRYNIDGKLYDAIKSLYSETISCIQLDDIQTEWFEILLGVRQGDTLSPTLFNIFINELAKQIKQLNLGIKLGQYNISMLMYADDIVLLAENETDLKTMLDTLTIWCNKWRLTVNENKSGIMHVRSARKSQSNCEFYIDQKRIPNISSYKYLGVIFDEHLTFKKCSKAIAESAGRALSKIIGKFQNFKNINCRIFTKLYYTCVWPILDYCSSIWSYGNYFEAEKIQNRAIRYFLGIHRNSCIAAYQGEMGWLFTKYKYYTSMLRLWNRIMRLPSDNLTRCIFEYNMQNFNENSWEGNIFEIFNKLQMINNFYNGDEIDVKMVENKLYDICNSEWQDILASKTKLRTYCLIKNQLETENYLLLNVPKYKRSIFTQLRIGTLPLEIEVGRYYRKSIENRICKLCSLDIEDEIHFLCICPKLKDIRVNFFKTLSVNLNVLPLDNFFLIMTHNECKSVINFVYQLWKKRSSLLFETS